MTSDSAKWRRVPVEPTEAMVDGGGDCIWTAPTQGVTDTNDIARLAYAVMVNRAPAAPEAPTPATEEAVIETDPHDSTRQYIPLPGGWEVQTKGKGSSYRLLDKKTDERHTILTGDPAFIQAFVTRMAEEVYAASRPASVKAGPEMREAVARAICVSHGEDPDEDAPLSRMCTADNMHVPYWHLYEEQAEAVIALLAGQTAAGDGGEVPGRMTTQQYVLHVQKERAQLEARISELEAALEPFVREADRLAPMPDDDGTIGDGCQLWQCGGEPWSRTRITYGDLRRARSLVSQRSGDNG